ncbi:MAG TPA: hypothetical protein VF898_14795, partial [Chloroflexota bacterium]
APATRAHLLGHSFFPSLIAPPFMDGLRDAFYVSAGMALVASIASWFRGKQYFHEASSEMQVVTPMGANATSDVEAETEDELARVASNG